MRWNCLLCCRGVQLLPGGNFTDYTYSILTTASSVTFATHERDRTAVDMRFRYLSESRESRTNRGIFVVFVCLHFFSLAYDFFRKASCYNLNFIELTDVYRI